MNIQNASSYLTVSLGLLALCALWFYAKRSIDKDRPFIEALERAGLTAPLFLHIDSEDRACSYGEATLNGVRVRFNTNRRHDGKVHLTLSSRDGHWPEGKISEVILKV